MKGYKGFDKDMKCKDFQYEIGKTYKYDGEIGLCEKGFHFCENPIDVLSYYPLIGSNFAEVETDGKFIKKEKEDSKVCTDSITIKAKIDIKAFVGIAIKGVFDFIKEKTKTTSGDSAHSATSGDSAHSATSGDSAHSATSGDYANSATSGNSAHSATSGNSAHSATSGEGSIACSVGKNGQAKSIKGNWLVLSEIDDNYKVICVKTIKVDGKKIKADTWYMLKNGKFVEVK